MAEILTAKYGVWGIVAGGSDGVGAAFAHRMASRGMNVVLAARRLPVLQASADDIRARHGVEVRTVALDLSVSGALSQLERARLRLPLRCDPAERVDWQSPAMASLQTVFLNTARVAPLGHGQTRGRH
jgi:NAD(P)-dependent dehydrogenase (short-subunit alcohol dehydrogenase family)